MKKAVLITIGLFILYGCASKLYVPAPVNVEKARAVSPDITLEQMRSARDLYITKCSSCHNLHLPREFTAPEWQKNLDRMQPKAKITDAQKQLLYAYLVSGE